MVRAKARMRHPGRGAFPAAALTLLLAGAGCGGSGEDEAGQRRVKLRAQEAAFFERMGPICRRAAERVEAGEDLIARAERQPTSVPEQQFLRDLAMPYRRLGDVFEDFAADLEKLEPPYTKRRFLSEYVGYVEEEAKLLEQAATAARRGNAHRSFDLSIDSRRPRNLRFSLVDGEGPRAKDCGGSSK